MANIEIIVGAEQHVVDGKRIVSVEIEERFPYASDGSDMKLDIDQEPIKNTLVFEVPKGMKFTEVQWDLIFDHWLANDRKFLPAEDVAKLLGMDVADRDRVD